MYEEAQSDRKSPPYGGPGGQEAAGEERGMPALRHAEDDGDAWVQQRRLLHGHGSTVATTTILVVIEVVSALPRRRYL